MNSSIVGACFLSISPLVKNFGTPGVLPNCRGCLISLRLPTFRAGNRCASVFFLGAAVGQTSKPQPLCVQRSFFHPLYSGVIQATTTIRFQGSYFRSNYTNFFFNLLFSILGSHRIATPLSTQIKQYDKIPGSPVPLSAGCIEKKKTYPISQNALYSAFTVSKSGLS